MDNIIINPLMPGGNKRVYTYLNKPLRNLTENVSQDNKIKSIIWSSSKTAINVQSNANYQC